MGHFTSSQRFSSSGNKNVGEKLTLVKSAITCCLGLVECGEVTAMSCLSVIRRCPPSTDFNDTRRYQKGRLGQQHRPRRTVGSITRTRYCTVQSEHYVVGVEVVLQKEEQPQPPLIRPSHFMLPQRPTLNGEAIRRKSAFQLYGNLCGTQGQFPFGDWSTDTVHTYNLLFITRFHSCGITVTKTAKENSQRITNRRMCYQLLESRWSLICG